MKGTCADRAAQMEEIPPANVRAACAVAPASRHVELSPAAASCVYRRGAFVCVCVCPPPLRVPARSKLGANQTACLARQTRIGGGQPCGGGEVQLPAPDLQQQLPPFPQLHWPALCCEYSAASSNCPTTPGPISIPPSPRSLSVNHCTCGLTPAPSERVWTCRLTWVGERRFS